MAQGNVWYKDDLGWHPCVTGRAPYSYQWVSGDWGPCSVECGGGVQERTVTCQDSSGAIVDDSFCEIQLGPKPDEIRDCNVEECLDCRFIFNGGVVGAFPGDNYCMNLYSGNRRHNKYMYIFNGNYIGRQFVYNNQTYYPTSFESYYYVNDDGYIYYQGDYTGVVKDAGAIWGDVRLYLSNICRKRWPNGLESSFVDGATFDTTTTGWVVDNGFIPNSKSSYSRIRVYLNGNIIFTLDDIAWQPDTVDQFTHNGVLYSMGSLKVQTPYGSSNGPAGRNWYTADKYSLVWGADPKSVIP